MKRARLACKGHLGLIRVQGLVGRVVASVKRSRLFQRHMRQGIAACMMQVCKVVSMFQVLERVSEPTQICVSTRSEAEDACVHVCVGLALSHEAVFASGLLLRAGPGGVGNESWHNGSEEEEEQLLRARASASGIENERKR